MSPSGRPFWEVPALGVLFMLLLLHPTMPLYVDGHWIDSLLRFVLDAFPLGLVSALLQTRLAPGRGRSPGNQSARRETVDGFTAGLGEPGTWLPWMVGVAGLGAVSHYICLTGSDFRVLPTQLLSARPNRVLWASVVYVLQLATAHTLFLAALSWKRGPTTVRLAGRTLSIDDTVVHLAGHVRIEVAGGRLLLMPDREDAEPRVLYGHPDDLEWIEERLAALPPAPRDDGTVPEDLSRLRDPQASQRER